MMAAVNSHSPSGDQSSFKPLPQPPSNVVREQMSMFQSQTPEVPDNDERPLPDPSSLLAMVPDKIPPRVSVLYEHARKPSASGSSVYSSHTVRTGDSWTNTPQRRESASSLVWDEAIHNPAPDSPVLGTKKEDQFELEEVLKTTQIMHSNSISSTTSSSGRAELWRRRSQKSERSVKITDLRLAQSNGFTASQPLRNTSASNGPQIPLPAVPRKAPQPPTGGLPARPSQFVAERNLQQGGQPEPPAQQYSHPSTQYSQFATGPVPYNLPSVQSQDTREQTQHFPTKQSTRKPVPLRPAPPQPETMGGRLSNLKNKFRSTEQLYQPKDAQVPGHTPQGSIDAASPKHTGLLNRLRGSTEGDNVPTSADSKSSGSAFSKLKHKLRSSDGDDHTSLDLPSPDGSSWGLSKLKNKLRNSGNSDEAAAPASTPTWTQPPIVQPPTPDYQKQDPAPAPLTPYTYSPYSPQISPDNQPTHPSSQHSSRPGSRSGPQSSSRPGSRAGSRPASRQGSRPPSRARQLSNPPPRPQLRPADASLPSTPIFEEPAPPVDPSQAHIHPLLRTKPSLASSDETLTAIPAPPRAGQPPLIAISSPLALPEIAQEPPHGRATAPKTTMQEPPHRKSTSPKTQRDPSRRVTPPQKSAPEASPRGRTTSPKDLGPLPPTPTAPATPDDGAAAASAYKLQVPGEISKRMTTILESSPFLATASAAAQPDDAAVYAPPPLAVTQIHCYQGHRVMHRSRNDVYALACGVCGAKDREGRWCCAWCAVRCCGECVEKVKGKGLEGMVAGGMVAGGMGEMGGMERRVVSV